MNYNPVALFAALTLCACGGVRDDSGAGKTRGALGAPSDTSGAPAPPGSLVLIGDAGDGAGWRNERSPASPLRWKLDGGVLTVAPGAGSLITTEAFEDFRLHLEFRLPSGSDGNSGIYIQRRYELQILAPTSEVKPHARCGALYRLRAPDSEAARPPGEWQTFDIVFRAARWDGDTKVENARVTAHLNGQLIHDDVPIPAKTGAGREEGPAPAPLKLQDHGAAVAFRNTWLVPLDLDGSHGG